MKYEYHPNFEVSYAKVYIVFHIISTIFITAFFLRSFNLSNVQKSNKTTNITDMIGQKRSFDVIMETKVKFKDVAGLDESKI